MPYEYLEDIAIADVAFEVWANDLEELFIEAADATMNVMVEELDSILSVEKRKIELHAEELDMLLFSFLQELIYYKDSECLLLRVKELQIDRKDHLYTLKAIAVGEVIDPDKHKLGADIKAVTLHRFRLERTNRGWEALVILDV